jgi:hypothetical protein
MLQGTKRRLAMLERSIELPLTAERVLAFNVSMLTAISVSWFTKPELERNLFPRISVQVEPERVEPFWMKRIRSR